MNTSITKNAWGRKVLAIVLTAVMAFGLLSTAAPITAYAVGTATIGYEEIPGVVGLPLDETIVIRIQPVFTLIDEWNNIDASDIPALDWFTGGLPGDVTATAKVGISDSNADYLADIIIISLRGTPTAPSSAEINITVPGSVLKGGVPIQVTPRSEALPKFAITDSPTAVINDVIISGKPNTALSSQTARVTLANVALIENLEAAIVTSWFTGLPNGVTAKATDNLAHTVITITFSDTPTAASSELINFTIPANLLTNNMALTVTANPNAKFNINPLLPGITNTTPANGPTAGDTILWGGGASGTAATAEVRYNAVRAAVTCALTAAPDNTAPILSGGSATRTSDTAATVQFSSNEAGTYYYQVDGTAPANAAALVSAGTNATTLTAAEQTITPILTAGAHTLYIAAKDAANNVSNMLTVNIPAYVAPPPSGTAPAITTNALASGTVGAAYSEALTATGTTPITWTLDGGSLPAELNLSGGVISGTPTTAETATFTVKATNSTGNDTKQLSITIDAAPPSGTAPTITTDTLPSGTVGAAYSQTLTATGDAPITWSLGSGSLPGGLTLSSAGAISGNPTATGTFAFTVKASNGVNPDATKDFSITIAAAPSALDTQNNVTIGGVSTNLTDNASGTGWTWDAGTKTLTLTGDTKDEIKIASATDEITIHITDNVSAPKIVKIGDGPLRITGETGKKLTVENTDGPAISSDGDIYIDSGTVKANVTGTGNTEPAIKAGGNVTITGTANVVASNSGTGDAINAGGGNGAITITGGRTEVTDQGSGTNPYPPTMSGANTVVIVNGQIIFGDPATPNNPDNNDESGGNGGGGGGCDAGTGAGTLALLAAALIRRR